MGGLAAVSEEDQKPLGYMERVQRCLGAELYDGVDIAVACAVIG